MSARMKAFWAKRRARAGGRQAAKEVACRKQGVLARRHLRYRGGGLDCRPSWHRQGRGTPPRVRRGGDSPTPAYGRMTTRLVAGADQHLDAAITPQPFVAEGAGLDPVRRHAGLNSGLLTWA